MYIITPGIALLGLIVALVVIGIAYGATDEARTRLGKATVFTGVFALLAAIVTGISAASTAIAATDTDMGASAADVSQEIFGLESGHEYPLELGSRLGGTSATITTSSGFFTAHTTVNLEASSILSIGFTSPDGRSYILEVPTTSVTFDQDAAAEPTVVIYLSDTRYSSAEYSYGTMVPVNQESCDWIVNTVFPVCQRDKADWELQLHEYDEQHLTLAQVVTDNVESVDITLTPEMYNRILGIE